MAKSVKEIAGALILTAKQDNMVERVIDDAKLLNNIFQLNQSLIQSLQDGLIDFEKRLQALDNALGDSIHSYTRNTLALLIQNNLLADFNNFMQALETQARELAGHYECTVFTAIELNQEKLTQIKAALEKKFSGTVRLNTKIDANIIGGMIIECGDWQYQSTIQSKLQQLYNHLVLN
ncbi:ATP synthase F1 subunit delta [Candidatus Uhrbacteria bacterium]|nr:ATP synthase F1 subunit delta [Candidatus Uhrbacteria bacterium]